MTTNLNPLDVNSDGVVPELPIPPYQGTPFLLARDGRTPPSATFLKACI
jgi:hypothetical protein